MLTAFSYANIAQALGLDLPTLRAERADFATQPIPVVETPPIGPPLSPYQMTADEAPQGGEDTFEIGCPAESRALDTSESYIGDRRESMEMIPDHTFSENEVFSPGSRSPNTATKEAMRHQDGSDNLFEADPFEATSTATSPRNSHSSTKHDCRIPEVRSTSPILWAQDGKEIMVTSEGGQRNEGLGLDRQDEQSCTDPSDTRRSRRRRMLHDWPWVVDKRQRLDRTHAVVSHMRS